jgi:hypothetical protein
MFLDHAASLVTPADVLDLLITESGTIRTPIRGIAHARSAAAIAALPIGTSLDLQRDYTNPVDPNAIRLTIDGDHAGYLAREVAHALTPLLDDTEGPTVTATLAVRPLGGDPEALESFDVVILTIAVTPRATSATSN